MLALSLATTALLTGADSANAGVALLEESRVEARSSTTLPMTERSFRARTSRIDRGAIRAALRTAEPLTLDLFDDLQIQAVPVSSKRLARGGMRWHGTPERDPNGSVVLVQRGGSLSGSVRIDDRMFLIRPWQGGTHIVEEVNLALLPKQRNDYVRRSGSTRTSSSESGQTSETRAVNTNRDDSTFKILVFFTGGARKQVGGRAATISLIELGIEETNIALEESGVDAQFELVAIKKIPGKESFDMGIDLDDLSDPSDDRFVKAQRLRERYEADFVHLIVDDTDPGLCGIAYLPNVKGEFASEAAYGVTAASCISPGYTIAHELGHNMGLEHDRLASDGGQGQFRFSYGYCAPGGAFHTIMAYYSSCPSPQALRFSSPRVLYNGVPAGEVGRADNARSINRVRSYLEAFRGGNAATSDANAAATDGVGAAESAPSIPAEATASQGTPETHGDAIQQKLEDRFQKKFDSMRR